MNVRIEKLVYGGEGLGHHAGQTIFVPFVLPEETVRLVPVERKKKFIRGRAQEILTASPDRTQPPCPYFTRCGGCHYQHIPYPAQLKYKAEILLETLRRIGRVRWEGPIETHASPELHYRNRAQWKVRAISSAPATRQAGIGYFQAGSTALCAVEKCPILSPRLEETLGALQDVLGRSSLPPTLREVEAFADSSDTKLLLNASFASFERSPSTLAEPLLEALPGIESLLLAEGSSGRCEQFGAGFLPYRVGETTYRVSHRSFFQVNRFLIAELVQQATANGSGRLALDLFAGVGLFTIPLGHKFERVIGVESNPAAADDLKANLHSSGIAAEAVHAEVEAFLAAWTESPDLVVVDPPRTGLSTGILSRLIDLAPARITYISCDPSTLARDLGALSPQGARAQRRYRLTEVHLLDLFPHTFHIESVIQLARQE
jgi:23S rRNA (uracil1939-C5)-methyltransferase